MQTRFWPAHFCAEVCRPKISDRVWSFVHRLRLIAIPNGCFFFTVVLSSVWPSSLLHSILTFQLLNFFVFNPQSGYQIATYGTRRVDTGKGGGLFSVIVWSNTGVQSPTCSYRVYAAFPRFQLRLSGGVPRGEANGREIVFCLPKCLFSLAKPQPSLVPK